jgi:membrane protease subunit HflC
MTKAPIFFLILVFVLLLILSGTVYQTNETEQVIVTQFGRPVGSPVTNPGLHVKLPLIQKANYFDKRFLEWDGDANQVATKDKRYIWVDTYARWRISDPLKFFQRVQDERGAQSRLDDILDGETRSSVARHDLVEVVRSSNRAEEEILISAEEEAGILEQIEKGRRAITREILERASMRAQENDLGIEVIDIRFKRINYVEEVQKDVFARMIAERRRIAERFRSEGEGEAARIRGERERDLKQIQSEAYRTAQEISGKADAEATQVYADAYNRDSNFYSFTKSLETYERTLDPKSLIILTTNSELLHYLKRLP